MQKFTLFVFWKNQTACFFSYKLITFNSNWSINLPRETTVDIVLDVLVSSHGNVLTEVLSKVVAYQYGVC